MPSDILSQKTADITPEFGKVVVIGPDIDGRGGMAEVLRLYRTSVFPLGEYCYMSTNDGRGFWPGLAQWFKVMTLLPGFRRKGKKILHIHIGTGKSFYRKLSIALWGRLLGFKVLLHWHGGRAPAFFANSINRFFLHRLMGCVSGILSLSTFWNDFFISLGVNPDKIYELPNPVPLPSTVAVKDNDEVVFVYMGMLRRDKGIYDLLEAARILKGHIAGWKLLIAGTGEDDKVKQQIVRYGLNEKVQLLGWIDKEKKQEVLNTCDVIVLPSYAEALPMSVLEGMANSAAVISTNVGALPQYVKGNGFLCNPGDIHAMADNMRAYIENRALLRNHQEDSSRRVSSCHPAVVKTRLGIIYHSILNTEKSHHE